MAEKRRGLGRGLGSLIPSQETGRPSDVFFPRSERSEPDVSADAPATDRDKLPSDPAESMRRAQAGRRTGTAKRAPSKATGSKTTSKSAATKATTAASKTATSTGRKTPAAGGAPKASSAPAAPVPGAATVENTPEKSHKPADHTQSVSVPNTESNDGPDARADGASEAISPEQTDTSPAVEAPQPVRSSRVGGVYVSHETVRTHPASDPVQPDSTDGVPVEGHAVQHEAPAEGSVADMPGDAASPEDAPDIEVPRETHVDAKDSFDDLVPVPGTTFGEIALDRIRPNPRQPRDVFDEDALDELITSIREIGVLQPVVVRRRSDAPGQYELIMGERRFRASKEAGKQTIPAIVRETSNDDLLRDALLENLHRVDLNPLEEAAAYAQLLEDFDCTQEELSERIGRSRPQISNTIRLLKLPAMVQRRVAAGVLSSGHARALLGLNDGADMEVLAQRVVAEGLSVRATEEAVVLLNRGDRTAVSRGTRQPDPELAELARSLGDRLDTRVNLVMGKRKGKLSVEFANGEDLSRILSLLGLDGGNNGE